VKIVTRHIRPPIADTRWDWEATYDGYEPGDPIGYGPTELKAIEDLKNEATLCAL
jgi:hypothetical protein